MDRQLFMLGLIMCQVTIIHYAQKYLDNAGVILHDWSNSTPTIWLYCSYVIV